MGIINRFVIEINKEYVQSKFVNTSWVEITH